MRSFLLTCECSTGLCIFQDGTTQPLLKSGKSFRTPRPAAGFTRVDRQVKSDVHEFEKQTMRTLRAEPGVEVVFCIQVDSKHMCVLFCRDIRDGRYSQLCSESAAEKSEEVRKNKTKRPCVQNPL